MSICGVYTWRSEVEYFSGQNSCQLVEKHRWIERAQLFFSNLLIGYWLNLTGVRVSKVEEEVWSNNRVFFTKRKQNGWKKHSSLTHFQYVVVFFLFTGLTIKLWLTRNKIITLEEWDQQFKSELSWHQLCHFTLPVPVYPSGTAGG